MSEAFEKEGTIPTLISALAAWLALGTGLALLCVGLLGILQVTEQRNRANSLQESVAAVLGPDIASASTETLVVSKDGLKLEFLRKSAGAGQQFPVVYALANNKTQLTRESGTEGKLQLLGHFPGLQFRQKDGQVELSWLNGNTRVQQAWTLSRWNLK